MQITFVSKGYLFIYKTIIIQIHTEVLVLKILGRAYIFVKNPSSNPPPPPRPAHLTLPGCGAAASLPVYK